MIAKIPNLLAMKFGVSRAKTTCLPRTSVRNAAIRTARPSPRFSARNNLHQPHLTRGIEEMGAQESGGEFLRSPLDETAYA